ncbi:MAG TPA: tetratricopeptide repeat protein [Longimicrobium sp.]|nr:tetratricopeptide repeat protein [Longimicrobium sp.]
MPHLSLTGRVDLRDDSGSEISPILAQPKRLALLAYLALAGRRGMVRRDTLLPLFWPEFDEARARRALSRAVHFLRQALGDGVVVGRGSEELGVDGARLSCDACRIQELLDEGRPEDALALYHGELMPGWHVEQAPEWEMWLARERAHLRGRAREAAWELAERAEDAGDAVEATRWSRTALLLSPDDEPSLRRLVGLLDRAGDRAGALREYDDFARRLAAEYELEPAPETRRLLEEVRAREEPSPMPEAPPPPPPVLPGETSTPVLTPEIVAVSPPEDAGSRSQLAKAFVRPRWGRAGLAAAAVLVLALLAVVLLPRRRSDAAPAGEGRVVAVFPFAYHGDARYTHLAEGFASLLAADLDGVAELRSVDFRAVAGSVPRTERRALEPRRAGALARRLGAGLFVLGDLSEVDGRVRLSAALYGRGEPEPRARMSVQGSADRTFELVDQLTVGLLDAAGIAGGRTRSAMRSTRSIPALQAYFQGEAEFRAGRYAEAVQAYRRAVAADSTFALAYHGLSQSADWTGAYQLAGWAAAEAERRAGGLPEGDRLPIQAWHAYLTGDPRRAEGLYRRILSTYPNDVEALFYLGEVQYHWLPSLGGAYADSRAAFERVLALEPHNVGALIHLARIAAGQGRRADFDALVARIARQDPASDRILELRVVGAFAFGGAAERRAAADRLAAVDNEVLRQGIVTAAALASPHLDGVGELLVPQMIEGTQNPTAEILDYLLGIQVRAARGQLRAAHALLDSVRPIHPAWTAEYRAVLALLPGVDDRAALQRARAELGQAGGTGPERAYLLGRVGLALGDTAAAGRRAEELARPGGSARQTAAARDLGRLLRAHLLAVQGRPADALTALGDPRPDPSGLLPSMRGYARAHERWLRGELLRALGRPREAVRWYASFPDPQAYDLAYRAPALSRLAELHALLGDEPAARAARERHQALRRSADN